MKKSLKDLLKILVSLTLLIFLVSQVDVTLIATHLMTANPWWIGLAILLFGLSILPRAVRWKILLDALEVHVPLRILSAWYYIGAFFNTILPTGFGGDVVKAVELARYSQQTPAAVGTVLLDRFLGILVLLGMGVIAIPFGRANINPLMYLLVVVAFLGCAGGFWLIRQEYWLHQVQSKLLPLLPRLIRQRVETITWGRALYQSLQGYTYPTLGRALLASLVFNLVWIMTNIAAGWALGIEASFADYLVFVPLISLALLLPSFGGLGVRELSYVGLFTQIGVSEETALALSIIIYASMVATALFGGVLLLVSRLNKKIEQPDLVIGSS